MSEVTERETLKIESIKLYLLLVVSRCCVGLLHQSLPSGYLPRGDQVLSQVDGDRCPCDGDVTVAGAVDLTADLDLSPRHLPDLVYLGALATDD